MKRNIYLDKFKEDIKNFNCLFREVHEEVVDIVDGDGFYKKNSKEIYNQLIELTRFVIRLRNSANSLEEYILEGARFTFIRYRLDEIYSGLKIIDLASKTDRRFVFNNYLDDMLSMLIKLSDNIASWVITVNSEAVADEELHLLKKESNNLRVVKDK